MEPIAVREGLSEARCRNKWLFPVLAVVAACVRQLQAKTSETGGVLQVGKCSSKTAGSTRVIGDTRVCYTK